jgi:hypothetical protein
MPVTAPGWIVSKTSTVTVTGSTGLHRGAFADGDGEHLVEIAGHWGASLVETTDEAGPDVLRKPVRC